MTDLPGSRAALSPRLLAGLFLGAVVLVIAAVVIAVVMVVTAVRGPSPRAKAMAAVVLAHQDLAGTMSSVQAKAAACQTNLPCVTRQYAREEKAFAAFGAALRHAATPDGAASAASARLRQDTARLAADFRALSAATSGRQFQELIASSGVMPQQARFTADYQWLVRALSAG